MNGKRGNVGGWLTLAVALALTACAGSGDERVEPNPLLTLFENRAGLIAYLGTDGNIHTIDQGGDNDTALTTDAKVDENEYFVYGLPTWAPNSETLVFAAFQGQQNNNPDKNSLFVAKKDGSELKEAYSSQFYPIYYAWSPDSQHIGLLSATGAGRTLALKRIPAAGGEAETLDVGSPFYWSWGPDSNSLLIHTGSDSGRLALLQLGKVVTEQNLAIKPSAFKAPAFAPNGQRMLVASQGEGGKKSALLLADQRGNTLKTLTEYDNDIAFVWSPSGAQVAYVTVQEFSGPITVLDPDNPDKTITVQEEAYAFFWSPDSRSLAYFTAQTVQLTPQPGAEAGTDTTALQWTLKVLDVSSGNTRSLADVFLTRRFMELVPYFDQYHQALTIWSPDSQNLVVSAYNSNDGTPEIMVVHVSGQYHPRIVAEGLVGIWSWK
jgi:Tol biopolymer transport system component